MDNYYPRLKDLREDHDLSQQQISDFLGMKQPQYSRYERGLRDIPSDVLIRLAKFYHTSTDYILGLTNNSKPNRRPAPGYRSGSSVTIFPCTKYITGE